MKNDTPEKISWKTFCTYFNNDYDTPIPAYGSNKCVLVIKPTMGLELQMRDKQAYTTALSDLPALTRFSYEKAKTATYEYLAIRCELPSLNEAVLDFFYSIANNWVNNKYSANRALVKSYEQYKAILSCIQAPLIYTLKGLWGELYVLNQAAANPRIDAVSLVYNWTGPEGQPNDFSFGTTAIEVKTTSNQKNVIEISSFDQLDAARGWIIILHAFHAGSQNGGTTIEELKDSISAKLNSATKDTLENKITSVLNVLSSPQSLKFSMKVTESPTVIYMSDSIPLLHRSNLKAMFGEKNASLIKGGKYVLDLSNVEFSRQTIGDIFLEAQTKESDNE